MPSASDYAAGNLAIDESEGLFMQINQSLELKADGETPRITGYLATKGVDKAGQLFTDDALIDAANQINNRIEQMKASVIMPDPKNPEDVETAAADPTTGNISHQNYQGAQNLEAYQSVRDLLDTRTVEAFDIVGAEFDGFGVKVDAELNTDLPEDILESIKALIRNGRLKGFSIEYGVAPDWKATKVVDGREVEVLNKVKVKGAALTGRPVQPRALLTDMELKAMIGDVEEEAEGEDHEDDEDIEITGDTMPEEDAQPEDEAKAEAEAEDVSSEEVDEAKGLSDDVSELKEEVKSLAESHKELQHENEELKSELEDYQQMDELKGHLDEIRDEIKSLQPEDQPRVEDEQSRDEAKAEVEQTNEDRLDAQLSAKGEADSQVRVSYANEMKGALAEQYNVSEDRVMEIARDGA